MDRKHHVNILTESDQKYPIVRCSNRDYVKHKAKMEWSECESVVRKFGVKQR